MPIGAFIVRRVGVLQFHVDVGYTISMIQASELGEIKELVALLETENPLQEPTKHLELLAGQWGVLFTTIKVTVSFPGVPM